MEALTNPSAFVSLPNHGHPGYPAAADLMETDYLYRLDGLGGMSGQEQDLDAEEEQGEGEAEGEADSAAGGAGRSIEVNLRTTELDDSS